MADDKAWHPLPFQRTLDQAQDDARDPNYADRVAEGERLLRAFARISIRTHRLEVIALAERYAE